MTVTEICMFCHTPHNCQPERRRCGTRRSRRAYLHAVYEHDDEREPPACRPAPRSCASAAMTAPWRSAARSARARSHAGSPGALTGASVARHEPRQRSSHLVRAGPGGHSGAARPRRAPSSSTRTDRCSAPPATTRIDMDARRDDEEVPGRETTQSSAIVRRLPQQGGYWSTNPSSHMSVDQALHRGPGRAHRL